MSLIKKRILLVLLFLVLMITGCKKDVNSHEFKIDTKMNDILLLKTDATKESLCLITTGEKRWYASTIIPVRYIVLMDVEGAAKDVKVGTNLVRKSFYKRFFINIHSLETKELMKTYSIKELEKGVPADYCISSNKPLGFRSEGQDYLRISTSYVGKNPDHTVGFFLIINIDTDEMRFIDIDTYYEDFQENSEKASRYHDQLRVFFDWTQEPDPYYFLDINGFKLFDGEDYKSPTRSIRCVTGWDTQGVKNEGIAEVSITTYALPKENKELYSKFPGLKQYQGQEGLVAQIFLGNYPSAEEVMKLFLEEGQEISFEGCVMDGKYSIDGLPHEINSFAEFDQWFKPEEY